VSINGLQNRDDSAKHEKEDLVGNEETTTTPQPLHFVSLNCQALLLPLLCWRGLGPPAAAAAAAAET